MLATTVFNLFIVSDFTLLIVSLVVGAMTIPILIIASQADQAEEKRYNSLTIEQKIKYDKEKEYNRKLALHILYPEWNMPPQNDN